MPNKDSAEGDSAGQNVRPYIVLYMADLPANGCVIIGTFTDDTAVMISHVDSLLFLSYCRRVWMIFFPG